MAGTHVEHEDHPWSRSIPDHPARTDSPLYKQSRMLMLGLVGEAQPWTFGPGPYQDHHGGAAWVKTKTGVRMYLLSQGVEWSAQWCADPKYIDALRLEARDLVEAFPGTVELYEQLGFPAGLARKILDEPITDADGVGRWTDSPFNASVPLPAGMHTGVLNTKNPQAGGYHHYPKPIVDIQFFKRQDFVLWVADEKGRAVAVAPTSPRGSGDSRVEVLFTPPGSKLHQVHQRAHKRGERLILDGDHPLAKQAFAQQE